MGNTNPTNNQGGLGYSGRVGSFAPLVATVIYVLNNKNNIWYGNRVDHGINRVDHGIRVSECCLILNEHFLRYIMARTLVTVDEMMMMRLCPLCTRPTRLVVFLCDSSLQQRSEGKYVPALGHIILILSQPVFACLA